MSKKFCGFSRKVTKIPKVEIVYKEDTKKMLIRVFALFGAVLMFGSFCFSLLMSIF